MRVRGGSFIVSIDVDENENSPIVSNLQTATSILLRVNFLAKKLETQKYYFAWSINVLIRFLID